MCHLAHAIDNKVVFLFCNLVLILGYMGVCVCDTIYWPSEALLN